MLPSPLSLRFFLHQFHQSSVWLFWTYTCPSGFIIGAIHISRSSTIDVTKELTP